MAQTSAPNGALNFDASTALVSCTRVALDLHSSIARYPSTPSGASAYPSGLSYPPTCVTTNPRCANASQTASSNSVGSLPRAVLASRSISACVGGSGGARRGHAELRPIVGRLVQAKRAVGFLHDERFVPVPAGAHDIFEQRGVHILFFHVGRQQTARHGFGYDRLRVARDAVGQDRGGRPQRTPLRLDRPAVVRRRRACEGAGDLAQSLLTDPREFRCKHVAGILEAIGEVFGRYVAAAHASSSSQTIGVQTRKRSSPCRLYGSAL